MGVPAVKLPLGPFVDLKTGLITRAWQQWLLNPQFITVNLEGVIGVTSGGTGLGTAPLDGQILIGNSGSYILGAIAISDGLSIVLGPGSIVLGIAGIDSSKITTGVLASGRMPAYSGDASSIAGNTVLTLATVNASAGSYGSASRTVSFTVNGKGLITAATDQSIAITNSQVSGLGTLSTQAANNVAITGGAIDGTPIGATTTATIRGTTLTATGAFGCNGKTAQTSATVNGAIGGTAGATYTATEQTMLNDLKALVNQLRTALINNGIAV